MAIATPEGIEIAYTLAGIASRYIAALIDLLVKLAVFVAVVLVFAAAGATKTVAAGLAEIVATFLLLFAYDIGFEVWGSGRTPGKRLSGLRVVTEEGRPVTLAPSAVRRLLWLVDVPITALIAGTVSILATERNQRLGDLAAGTVVVREERRPLAVPTPVTAGPAVAGLDVTAISVEEIAAVRNFLARREALAPAARERVAQRLASGLVPRVGGLPPDGLAPEVLLASIAAAKR